MNRFFVDQFELAERSRKGRWYRRSLPWLLLFFVLGSSLNLALLGAVQGAEVQRELPEEECGEKNEGEFNAEKEAKQVSSRLSLAIDHMSYAHSIHDGKVLWRASPWKAGCLLLRQSRAPPVSFDT